MMPPEDQAMGNKKLNHNAKAAPKEQKQCMQI
jgi:hypothetical protein